jgi:DUF4097 and DUF4098 domain-containing protein YvlB
MRSIRFVIQAVAIAAGVILSAGGCYVNVENWSHAYYERTVELEHRLADGSTLAVSTAGGSITVAGQAVHEARIVAVIRGQAPTEDEARELAKATEIRFEPTGERIAIKAHTPGLGRNRSVSISYDIVVPRRTSVECGSASGAIRISNLQGSVRANTASGSVTCEAVGGGDVLLGSASGAVWLSNASDLGSCEVKSVSGRASAERVQADCIRINSTSGPVELLDARAGTIDMRGTSGRMHAREIHCSRLSAECVSGAVSIEFAPSAPADLTASAGSISGSVSLVAPPDFAGRVELSTVSGSIHSDLPIQVQGQISKRQLSGGIREGNGSLSLRTTSGSIRLR